MKINKANIYGYNITGPVFKGLWGKTSLRTDFDAVMNIPIREYSYYYYPFNDEAKESIDKQMAETENAKIEVENGNPKYNINDFKLCMRLPFTEQIYQDYSKISNLQRLSEKKLNAYKKMHDYIKTKFLTKEYNNQIPAANKIFDVTNNGN